MPTNLLKRYPELLELGHLSEREREGSLRRVYDRDFQDTAPCCFRKRPVRPIKRMDAATDIDILFRHLITTDAPEGSTGRVFDMPRSQRLHWIRHHLDEKSSSAMLVFSIEDRSVSGRKRLHTYLLDTEQRYVVILEPYRKHPDYYLITAYPLEARNFKKLKQRYARRLPDVL